MEVTKPPDAYLPPTNEFTVEEIIDIAKEATTLHEVTRKTRLSRGTARKVLRACEQYHEVEFWFGKNADDATTRIEQLREKMEGAR